MMVFKVLAANICSSRFCHLAGWILANSLFTAYR